MCGGEGSLIQTMTQHSVLSCGDRLKDGTPGAMGIVLHHEKVMEQADPPRSW
jgi:hypothetical protein